MLASLLVSLQLSLTSPVAIAPAPHDSCALRTADTAAAPLLAAVTGGEPAPQGRVDTVGAGSGGNDSTAAGRAAAPPPSDTALVAGIGGTSHPVDLLPGPLDMLTNIPGDWAAWARTTFTLENLPMIGGMTALTAGLVVTDYESWQPFKKVYDRSPFFHRISDAFTYVGDGKFQFGLAGLFAAYGFIFGDTTALRAASQTFEVILACGTVVQVLKHATGRESPFAATTPTGRWALLPNQIEYHKHVPHYDAFPSGHIATALATLTVAIENYPDEKWLPWLGYPAVAMVGIGLVATSIHWWSDIPLGLALGYSFGRIVAGKNRTAEYMSLRGPELGMSVTSEGTPALALTWRW